MIRQAFALHPIMATTEASSVGASSHFEIGNVADRMHPDPHIAAR
jgi:hypothetical protein